MDEFLTSVYRIQANQYLAASSILLLVYDCFLTLDLEIAFVWKAKWDIGKIVYLLARYPAFVAAGVFFYYIAALNLSFQTCHILIAFIHVAGLVVIAAAEVILMMRTFALSGNSRWLITFLPLLYAGVVTSVAVIIGILIPSLKYGDSPVPGLRSCYPIDGKLVGFIAFALILALETLIMVITLIIGIRKFRHTQSKLVVSLYSDGILFYIYIFFASLANILVELAGPVEMIESLIVFQTVMHSLLSCRVLLHVRRDATPNDDEQDYELDALSNLRFRRSGTELRVTPNLS